MTFLKQNWFKILIILLFVGGFWWFQLRPSRIRARCQELASIGKDGSESGFGFSSPTLDSLSQTSIDSHYKNCLRLRGL